MSEAPIPTPNIQSEITRSTAALVEYAEKPGIGHENRSAANAHILKVAGIVLDSPERVEADLMKSKDQRTEHDPERARLMALTTAGSREKVLKYQHRLAQGKKLLPGQRVKMEQNQIGIILGERLAGEVYDADPINNGPNMVELHRKRAVDSGSSAYKWIKGAKPPKK